MIEGMNHFTILTDDLDRTLAFYVNTLGLQNGWRPAFDFPGAWLYAGSTAVLHVVASSALPVPAAGVIDHMAFSARGLSKLQARLGESGIAYSLQRLPGEGPWQLFCHDPNGAKVELDFDASEVAAAQ